MAKIKVMNKENRERIKKLSLGRQTELNDWFPSLEDIESLNPKLPSDKEFMYWILTHSGEVTDKQQEIRERIADILGLDLNHIDFGEDEEDTVIEEELEEDEIEIEEDELMESDDDDDDDEDEDIDMAEAITRLKVAIAKIKEAESNEEEQKYFRKITRYIKIMNPELTDEEAAASAEKVLSSI